MSQKMLQVTNVVLRWLFFQHVIISKKLSVQYTNSILWWVLGVLAEVIEST